VQSVLQGRQFVSASLRAHADSCFKNAENTSNSWQNRVAPSSPTNVPIRHEVAFYADDARLEEAFARVTKAALNNGNTAVLIATKSHRTNILQILRREALDLDAAEAKGKYIEVDATDVLATIMVNDLPDEARCFALVDDLVGAVATSERSGPPRIAICGECAPTLLTSGQNEAAIQLEHLWDKVTRSCKADTLCGYLWASFPDKGKESVFQRICAEHSAVYECTPGY
jgi:hypothetical protein